MGNALMRRDFLKFCSGSILAGAASMARPGYLAGLAEASYGGSPDSEQVEVQKTPKDSYQIRVKGASIELNLVPMNSQIVEDAGEKVAYTKVRPDVVLLASPISCLVGIVGLTLDGVPRVPRVVWDNREHQFWDGFEGTYEPRNVVVNAPQVEVTPDRSAVQACCYYVANFVKTTIAWRFSNPPLPEYKCMWDTTYSIQNLTGKRLGNYVQFFASYHHPGTNYYWDSSNEIKPCSRGAFNATRGPEMTAILQNSPYTTHTNRYKGADELTFVQYAKPVLMSEKQPWFGGLRHVILVDPRACGALVTFRHQARDFLLRPPDNDLHVGESFTGKVRHVITAVDSVADVEKLWAAFEQRL